MNRWKRKGRWGVILLLLLGGAFLLAGVADRMLDPILYNALNPPRRTTEDFVRSGVRVTPQQYGGSGVEIFIRGSGGVQLRGWFLPSNRSPSISPLVILLHGMGDGCELLLEGGIAFQREGINSLCIDHRGFAKSEGSPSFGFHEREDIRHWIEWARLEKGIRGRVGLYGGSYGGSVGLQALAHNPEAKCLVALHPFTDLKAVVRDRIQEHLGFRWLPIVSWYAERKFCKAIGAGGWSDVSALELLKRRTDAPAIFLIHGTADRVVPVEHSRWLKERFPEQVEYIEIAGVGHDDLFSKGPPDLHSRMRHFLTTHLFEK